MGVKHSTPILAFRKIVTFLIQALLIEIDTQLDINDRVAPVLFM